MRTRFVALAIALVVTGAGCGGSKGSGDEPSSIVPASAYLYAEANLDPSGDQQDAARSVIGALPGVGEPSRRLQEQFDAYAQDRSGRTRRTSSATSSRGSGGAWRALRSFPSAGRT
jgi:hypothetical protein